MRHFHEYVAITLLNEHFDRHNVWNYRGPQNAVPNWGRQIGVSQWRHARLNEAVVVGKEAG